jgi:predicted PurR-regulated permease PerM
MSLAPRNDVTTKDKGANRAAEEGDWTFLRRLLIGVVVFGVAYTFWQISGVILLMFAAMLMAVILSLLANLATCYLKLPRKWSLPMVTVLLALVIVGFFWGFGGQISREVANVLDQLPEAFDSIGRMANIPDATERLTQAVASETGGQILVRTLSISYSALGVLADVAVVLGSAFYLAVDPSLYRRGVEKLFPSGQRDRVNDAMTSVGQALGRWAGGQFMAMIGVGTLSGLAFWAIGLPSSLALGIIAGLTNFIPLLGPILGATPALLFALAIDPVTALWTLGAVIAIQQVEGNVLTPLLQQQAVSLPPAVTVFALVIFGVLFGWLGIVLAVPLAVTVMVLVEKLWVEQALEQE